MLQLRKHGLGQAPMEWVPTIVQIGPSVSTASAMPTIAKVGIGAAVLGLGYYLYVSSKPVARASAPASVVNVKVPAPASAVSGKPLRRITAKDRGSLDYYTVSWTSNRQGQHGGEDSERTTLAKAKQHAAYMSGKPDVDAVWLHRNSHSAKGRKDYGMWRGGVKVA